MVRFPVLALIALSATPALADEPAPVAALIAKVDIPYEMFTLPNGLRVLVHTDRKAPLVAVSVWYHVGSKDEPAGKTGFAHLFEHLMFNGSEHAPDDFFKPMQEIGATDMNGTTSFDRTNYFETVPTGALERTLFLESDRMGHLLGGIDQTKLDNQRGVVQNEKRQDDITPFGLTDYTIVNTLFPLGHPYHHRTIGSMADLNGASLGDVKSWFASKYGPNNAVLALAGDIDTATAKTLVTKWFGDIPRGPVVVHPDAPVTTLRAPVSKVLSDRVPFTRIMRMWTVEGINGHDLTALDAAMTVLGGLSSSRLDNALVRSDRSAVSVSAEVQPFENVGIITVSADVRPGVDPVAVGKKLDALIADFLAHGPTEDELRRVATRSAAGTIAGLESVGGFSGKAVTLAEGLVYSNDPAKYKTDLASLAALTPGQVTLAARKWMSRPVFNLTVKPGPRDTSAAARAIAGDAPTPLKAARPQKTTARAQVTASTGPDRAHFPEVGVLPALDFPTIERATLSNGIPVYFAHANAVPVVRVAVSFDAGQASDPHDAPGTQALMLAALEQGTATRSSIQMAEESERLGASISTGASVDRTSISMFALTPNLGASLDLLADVIRRPAFAPAEVERVRGQQLAGIAAQLSTPSGLAGLVMPALLYGPDHPYGLPTTGNPAAVAKLTRDDLVAFHDRWIRPDNAQIFVIGDTSLAGLKPLLEAKFGNWTQQATPRPVKDFASAIPAPKSRVYLIDRPDSPQSLIEGGLVLNQSGRDDVILIRQAVDVLGGAFLSRLNTDIRETKGWSYGVSAGISGAENRVAYRVNAPVQTDRTGDALAAIIADTNDFLTGKGTTAEELDRTAQGAIRELPGTFETSDTVLGAMQRIVWLGRPDDYYEKLPARYGAMTALQLDTAARAAIDPSKMVWVVVGDAKTVRPQLDKIGLPVEMLTPPVSK